MNHFLSDAVASTSSSPSQSNPYSMIIMLTIFGLIFYFVILRPQQKRAREHKKMMSSITKNDEVLTNGGLIGRVTKITDAGYITLLLNETTEIVIRRDFITALLPKGTIKSL